jgi:hypothetical protein
MENPEIEALWAAIIAILLKLDERHRFFLSNVLEFLEKMTSDPASTQERREFWSAALERLAPLRGTHYEDE